MLRALYSGISGMKVNQTKLDVIGNNISNVGTTSFKGSRVRFQDMINQNVKSALGPGLNQGGVNPSSVGLGVKLAGIDTIVSQGNMQPTSRNLDVAVDGDGYFMVAKGPTAFEDDDTKAIKINTDSASSDNHTVSSSAGFETMYTRDGSFTLDSEGNLLTSDGYRVLGYAMSDDTISNSFITTAGSGTEVGDINFVDADSTTLKAGASGNTSTDTQTYLKTLRIPDQVYDSQATDPKFVKVISFSIEKNGVVKAVLEDGRVSALGQIAMAAFKNPGGLEKLGSNLYTNSANSGDAIIRAGIDTTKTTTNDNSGNYGDMLQGMLEMSNVDLAEQFTEMIVTTRAFQASGKMISTGDEILQDIINLKR